MLTSFTGKVSDTKAKTAVKKPEEAVPADKANAKLNPTNHP
jgi:hypothetical protein